MVEYNYRVEINGYIFYVPDKMYKGEIERGHSQPFIGDMDVLGEFHKLYPDRKNIMIDVGGHIGLFAIPYSKVFNHVFSYEPHEENFRYFLKNLDENKVENVTPIQEAIMYGANRVTIVGYEKDEFITDRPRYSGMYTSIPDETGCSKATDLDDHHLGEPIDFIKIDVEGQEMKVLKSAERILAQHKPFLQIEIKDFEFFPDQPTVDDITNYLKQFGYKLFKKKVDYFFIGE